MVSYSISRPASTCTAAVSGVYLKRTYSRDAGASGAFLTITALYIGATTTKKLEGTSRAGAGCRSFSFYSLASTPPGMPGTHPPNILVGGTSTGMSPILLRTFGYSRPILVAQTLPTKPPKGMGCGEGCSPPTPHPIRWFVPPTLNSR